MSLSAADVAEIMRLVEQSTFDELTLEMDGVKLTLRRGAAAAFAGGAAAGAAFAGSPAASGNAATLGGAAAAQAATSRTNAAGAPPAALASATRNDSASAAATRNDTARGSDSARPTSASPPDVNVHEIPSPLLGTFYRSPKPGAAPFVDVGSVVDEDTTVAIIEVMKLMNTVRAGVRGTVTEVLASDGALVEFEQPLLRIRKAG